MDLPSRPNPHGMTFRAVLAVPSATNQTICPPAVLLDTNLVVRPQEPAWHGERVVRACRIGLFIHPTPQGKVHRPCHSPQTGPSIRLNQTIHLPKPARHGARAVLTAPNGTIRPLDPARQGVRASRPPPTGLSVHPKLQARCVSSPSSVIRLELDRLPA